MIHVMKNCGIRYKLSDRQGDCCSEDEIAANGWRLQNGNSAKSRINAEIQLSTPSLSCSRPSMYHSEMEDNKFKQALSESSTSFCSETNFGVITIFKSLSFIYDFWKAQKNVNR